jgi:hypothetical protein
MREEGELECCVQEYLYNHVFPSVFGDSHSWVTVLLEQDFGTSCLGYGGANAIPTMPSGGVRNEGGSLG